MITSEHIALSFCSGLLILELLNINKFNYLKNILWNTVMTYISLYYLIETYKTTIHPGINIYLGFEIVHHLSSMLLSLTAIINQFYNLPLILVLFLHYFKNIVVYVYCSDDLYFYFCIIYNLSYFGIFYAIYILLMPLDNFFNYKLGIFRDNLSHYKLKRENKCNYRDVLYSLILILIQMSNNFLYGYHLK
jgi:hypothetical protein